MARRRVIKRLPKHDAFLARNSRVFDKFDLDKASEIEITTIYHALQVADKHAFPVNMRTAIGSMSLNDAAKIGYLRGLSHAAEVINAAPTHKKARP